MKTANASLLLSESSRFIDQLGNSIVLDIYTRLREIEALTRSLAAIAEQLPRSISLFMQTIPAVLDFQSDTSIAGGGVWFEPEQFSPGCVRRSFFWGRNTQDQLIYFDDYNQTARGYHQEAWYVVGFYTRPGQCCWSTSYMDPYSYQLMVTCTTPMYQADQLIGVVTVDLKLEGLHANIDAWQKKTGGYLFVLDRNNQFITFPQPERVKKTYQDEKGNQAESLHTLEEFAADQPLFAPLIEAVQKMDATIVSRAVQHPKYDSKIAAELSQRSPQISPSEAATLAAIATNPLENGDRLNHLVQKFQVECDWLLQEAAMVFLFFVPVVYWKVFIIKPLSEITADSYNVIQADKLASLGQMLTGIAHEINNPLNFIAGNLAHAKGYIQDLFDLLNLYQQKYPQINPDIKEFADNIDLDFLVEDLPKLIKSMETGAERARQVSVALRNYSRTDDAEMKLANLHDGLDGSLMILQHRLKAKSHQPEIQVIKHYGSIPPVECYAGQLNQVFMNLIGNAIDALEEAWEEHTISSRRATTSEPEVPTQTIRADNYGSPAVSQTSAANGTVSATLSPQVIAENVTPFSPMIQIHTELIRPDWVQIVIADNGSGISPEVQKRLFDPFFTTKPVGKGTGLGLAICQEIVQERHHGQLYCESNPGAGARFVIQIPVRQTHST